MDYFSKIPIILYQASYTKDKIDEILIEIHE